MRSTGVDITEESKQRELLAKSGLKHLKDGEAEGSLRSVLSVEEGHIDQNGNEYRLGEGAVALGQHTKGSGKDSFAQGFSSVASGNFSHAEGTATKSVGECSHAEGRNTEATGNLSHAEGEATFAKSYASHTEGQNTVVNENANYAHAEGISAVASGVGSHAEGMHTKADGTVAHSEGVGTTAQGDYSHAEGNTTTANGEASHTEGRETTVIGKYSHAEGQGTLVQDGAIGAHAEGNITVVHGEVTHEDGTTTKGDYAHAEGQSTHAYGYSSHAEGYETKSIGTQSHAEGAYTQAIGAQSHAEGVGNTQSIGYGSHAEGQSTQAKGQNSHSEGAGTTALGVGSHAEGGGSRAEGDYSHAEGYQTIVHGEETHEDGTTTKGDCAHAEGENTQAYGRGSHAEGLGTQAKAQGSHAEGNGTIANGQWSHAAGQGTTANGMFSHAEGMQSVTEKAAMASHAEGYQCVTKNNFAHAEGNVNIAEGFASHAEGGNNTAKGQFSHAEGNNNFANAFSSHAEGGNNSIADNATYAHAEGEHNTIEGGNGVHVEGRNNKANNNASHAEGMYAEVNGLAAHAEGYECKALASYAHAGGYNTIASHESQTAIGKYNKDVDSLFSVGNGEYDEATKQPVRRDAFRVERDGGIVFLKDDAEVRLQDYHNTDTFNFQIDAEADTYYALASWDRLINGTTDTTSIGGMNLMMQVTTDANISQILTYTGKHTNGTLLTMCYYNLSYGAAIPYSLLVTDDRVYLVCKLNDATGIKLFQIKLLSVNAPNFRLERGTVINSYINKHDARKGYTNAYLYSRINSGSISGVEQLIYTASGGTKYLNINSDDTIDITGADDNDTNTVDWTFKVNKNAIAKPESVITIPYEDTHAIVLDVKLPGAIVDGGIMPEVLDSYLGKNIVVWVSKKETTSEDSGNLAYPGSMALVNLKFSSFDGKWGFVPELILRNGMKNADLRSNYKLIVDDDGLLTFSIAVRNGSVNDIITTKLLANNFPEAKLVWHNGAGEEYNDDSKTRIKGITTGYVHAAKWAKEDCCLEADGHYLYDSELSIVSKGFSAGSGLAGQMNIDNLYLFPENQSKYTCYIDRGVEHSFGYPAILESARVTVSKVSSEQHITNANTYYVEQEISGIEPSGNSVYYKRVGLVQLDIAEANPITWYPWQQIQTADVQYENLVITDDNVANFVVGEYLLIYPSTSIVSFETTTFQCFKGIKHIADSLYSLPNGKRVTILGNWYPMQGENNSDEYCFSTYLYGYRGGTPGYSHSSNLIRVFEDFLLFNKVWYSKGY